MSQREYLIARIRRQKDMLDELIQKFERKSSLDLMDYQHCEFTSKEVRKGLKNIHHSVTDELLKGISFSPEFLD